MSFRQNSVQQISFYDSFQQLTHREQTALEKSWAWKFAHEVFPYIDEEPFRVLYSDTDSRPNTPVNVCVGALIIKELQNLSDDEMLENLLLDPRYQTALHTTSFPEQPMSDRTLGRFRARCTQYMEETGIDLIHDCIDSITDRLASLMGITGRHRRMDSMMIAANIRKLGRLQLIYTCIAKVVARASCMKLEIPGSLQHYLDNGDYNRIFYHVSSEDNEKIFGSLAEEADAALQLAEADPELRDAVGLLKRCLDEQTIKTEEGDRHLRDAKDEDLHAQILQNPSDPDATFRKKAGRIHQGYVANLVESVEENASLITGYQFEQNTYSDSQFAKDILEKMEKAEETVEMVADGAYAGQEIQALAEEKNVVLTTTNLNGKLPDPVVAEFELNAECTAVVRCPAGHSPSHNGKVQKNGRFSVSFKRELCANCPHKDKCGAKIYKKVSKVTMSAARHARAVQAAQMDTEEFRNRVRFRNGVETVPSSMRRSHHADRMPVRGLARSRIVFGCKVCAFNIRKFMNFILNKGNYAQNPVTAAEAQ